MKKVSIILPIYNGEKYIDESIASIVNQTYQSFEIIVVNDGSTDSTAELLSRWAAKDPRIVVIDNIYEKGIHGALNTGLAKATGKYIARADADDINNPKRLEVQVAFLEKNTTISIIGSYYESFNLSGMRKVRKHPTNPAIIRWRFLTNTYFCHPTTMFRREVLNIIDRYPTVVCEDFAFFSQVVQNFKPSNIPIVLLEYREHETNYSHTKREAIEQSVRETFQKNFLYYTGSIEHADLFYRFHAQRDLALKDLVKVLSITRKIVQKILYKSHSAKETFELYAAVVKDVVVGIIFHYLRLLYRKIKSI